MSRVKRHRGEALLDVLISAALNAAAAPPGTFFYGGQAVIEGVLMRGRSHYAVAARRPDGTIALLSEALRSRVSRGRFWALPLVRGAASLWEMLGLGLRAMQWSAQIQLGEEVELSPAALRATVAVSLVFGLGLFIGLPLLASSLLRHGAPQSVGAVLIEGVARAAILLLYLALIGRVRGVRRVFEYHGAEHKAINCLESGSLVEVATVRPASRLHPRCGTGFLVVVALVSVLVFTPLSWLFWPLRILCQLALIPLVAGVSYEAIRGLATIRGTAFGRIALIPVLAAQRLSTREPDDAQIEVSITALAAARAADATVSEGHATVVP
jgi:uncharacterized protein YqhQ